MKGGHFSKKLTVLSLKRFTVSDIANKNKKKPEMFNLVFSDEEFGYANAI